MKKLLTILAAGLVAGVCMAESHSTTGTTSAAVVFGPGNGPTIVKSVDAMCDIGQATVTIQARTGKRVAIAATNNATTNIYFLVGANYNITNSDTCVYVHADSGTCDYRSVIATAGVTGTNIYFSAVLSETSKLGDWVYEVANDYLINFQGSPTNVTETTNSYLRASGDALYVSPGDSPVRVSVAAGGGMNAAVCKISATSVK